MARPYADELLPLWYSAMEEEIGLLIRTRPDEQSLLVNTLYEARQRCGDADLERMIILQPAPRGTIYIAHKATELDEP